MRVISLSTIPSRFATLDLTLESLLAQSARVDEIRLYVPCRYRRFPDYNGRAPQVPQGVRVMRVEEDLGPATKVLFAARELAGEDATILFCDDDRLFRPEWAEALFTCKDERPGECVSLMGKHLDEGGVRDARARPAARVGKRPVDLEYNLRRLGERLSRWAGRPPQRRVMRRPVLEAGYADILFGVGGVVVEPGFFDETAFDIPDVLWTVDDVWLSGMLARRDIPIFLPQGLERPAPSSADEIDALFLSTIEGAGRLEANQRCIDYMRERYGVWSASGGPARG